MASLAFFPLPLPPFAASDGIGDYRGWPYPWVSPAPLVTIGDSIGRGVEWPAARYLAGNVLAFVPLGVLAPLLSVRWRSWIRIAFLGFVVSLSIEVAQLGLSLVIGFPWRVADVDDLILNVAGTLVGFALWLVGGALVVRMLPLRKRR